MSARLLEVDDLHTSFSIRAQAGMPARELRAVDGVSFSIDEGEILGMVGESGSGKSVTGFSILGLIDPPGRIEGGRVLFRGRDLVTLPESELRGLRGNRIAMIFQDPMMTLNPVLRIGTQMVETMLAHGTANAADAHSRARDALGRVGIPSPEERLSAYPHQLSGGMRQRVAIAIALLNKPDLIIADEPTTALDVTIQGQIVSEMRALCRESGTALLWITHDLSVVSALADSVCVMYAGRIVESGGVDEVLESPRHPYTAGLLASLPGSIPRGQPLKPIPGAAPDPLALPDGCAFRTRCARAQADCSLAPAAESRGQRSVRCHHPLA